MIRLEGIILEFFRLFIEVVDIFEFMKSCFIKFFCFFVKVVNFVGMEELILVVNCFGIKVWDSKNNVIGSDVFN